VGTSDCEHIGQGLLAQPVNTLSSLAYLFAGVLLLQRALAGRSSQRVVLTVYAATVVAVGLGSVVFHGPMPSWGRFAHDVSIAAVLAFVIGYDIALVRGARLRAALIGFGALLGASAIVLAASPDASNALDAVLVVAAAIAEVAATRSSRRLAAARGLVGGPSVWIVGAAALAVGALLNALGRTDAPLCEPDSVVQLHAVWHVLTAVVLWMYGAGVLEPRERARNIIPA
jgi:predicted membrane channel-forming protein YqfA (hemolysin III family)